MTSYCLNDHVHKALKHYHLQDLIPYIENIVYREEKKKHKIHASIKEEVILYIGHGGYAEFLNFDAFASYYLDYYIKAYGLSCRDFLDKYGQKIKKIYFKKLKEYDDEDDEGKEEDEEDEGDEEDEEETEINKFFENKHILENIVEDYYAFCIKGEDYDDLTLKTMVSQVTFATFDGLLGKSGTDDLSGMDFWRIFIHMGIEEGAYQPLNGDEYDGFLYYLYRYINKE